MDTADLVPIKQHFTLGTGRFHRIPHDLRNVFVEVRDRDGNPPMWDLGGNVALGAMVTVHPDEVTIELPGDAEGLAAVIVGLPRSA